MEEGITRSELLFEEPDDTPDYGSHPQTGLWEPRRTKTKSQKPEGDHSHKEIEDLFFQTTKRKNYRGDPDTGKEVAMMVVEKGISRKGASSGHAFIRDKRGKLKGTISWNKF